MNDSVDDWGEEGEKGEATNEYIPEPIMGDDRWISQDDLTQEQCDELEKKLGKYISGGGSIGDVMRTREKIGNPTKKKRYIRRSIFE